MHNHHLMRCLDSYSTNTRRQRYINQTTDCTYHCAVQTAVWIAVISGAFANFSVPTEAARFEVIHASLCDFLNILPQLFAPFVNFFHPFTLHRNTTTRPVPVFPQRPATHHLSHIPLHPLVLLLGPQNRIPTASETAPTDYAHPPQASHDPH